MENVSFQQMEYLYRLSITSRGREVCKIVSLLAFLIFPLYAILDYFIIPSGALQKVLVIRFISTVFFGFCYTMARIRVKCKRPFTMVFMMLFVADISVTAMCWVMGGYESPYYAGINLIILTSVVLLPFNGAYMSFIVLTHIAVYVTGMFLEASFSIARPEILINNVFFMMTTAFIGVFAAIQRNRSRKDSFIQHLQLEKAQDNLKNINEVKDKFFANISHELRTPLTLILDPIKKIISDGGWPEKERAKLNLIEKNAKILLRHVNDLLEVVRLDSNGATIHFSYVDFVLVFKSVCALFENVAKEKRIKFCVHTPDQLIVSIDARKMERVLMNLLSNAFKMTPVDGSIDCELSCSKDLVHIKIKDSGPGVPEHFKEKIFVRFFQIEESDTRQSGGTGLGLSIAKEFVEMHKGSISISQNTNEVGVTFLVVIPYIAFKENAGERINSYVPELDLGLDEYNLDPKIEIEVVENKDPNLPLVLIVEDNYDMNNYIRSVLAPSFRVEQAFHGLDGLAKIRNLHPDLILTDLMMPGFSGMHLVETVKKDQEIKNIPILVLTAKVDEEVRVALLQLGANDYILKPFSTNELVARVSNWAFLKRSREILQNELRTNQDNIQSLVTEIVESKKETQSALKTRDEFISLASHELKTPLTSLTLQTQMARRKAFKTPELITPEFFKSLIESYDSQLKRLVKMIDDMLDISRIQRGNLEIDPSVVEVGNLVQGLRERNTERFKEAKVFLVNNIPDGVHGYWDMFKIEQVILNLVSNAIRYGKGNPVEVSFHATEASAVIRVKDEGIGISHEDQHRIFSKFERATSYRQFGGLGLGLYISKQFVEVHGGHIELQSELGKGSTFTVILPIQMLEWTSASLH